MELTTYLILVNLLGGVLMLFAFDYLAPHLNVLKTVLGILLIVNAVFMVGLRRGVNTIVAAVRAEMQNPSSYAKRGGLL